MLVQYITTIQSGKQQTDNIKCDEKTLENKLKFMDSLRIDSK